MNPRTRKMMDNKIWEYLEILGIEGLVDTPSGRSQKYKLQQIKSLSKIIYEEILVGQVRQLKEELLCVE